MTSKPIDFFQDLVMYLESNGVAPRISGSSLRLKFDHTINEPTQAEEESKSDESGRSVLVDIQVLAVDERKSCVKFSYKDPSSKLNLRHTPGLINHFLGVRDS